MDCFFTGPFRRKPIKSEVKKLAAGRKSLFFQMTLLSKIRSGSKIRILTICSSRSHTVISDPHEVFDSCLLSSPRWSNWSPLAPYEKSWETSSQGTSQHRIWMDYTTWTRGKFESQLTTKLTKCLQKLSQRLIAHDFSFCSGSYPHPYGGRWWDIASKHSRLLWCCQ